MKNKKVTTVFWVAVAISAVFIAWGAFLPENVEAVLGFIDGFLASNFGWFYLLVMTGFVIFAIFMIISPFGRIKLGKPDDKPEYSVFTWLSFLFTAGMGVGLVFFGVAEPLTHYYAPPSTDPGTTAASEESMQYTLFHWGVHPWSTYAVVALTLAYFKFRHRSPALISSALSPLFGDRMRGGWGHGVDVLAVFATVFGITTSLGLGALQITAGLSFSFEGIENNFFTQMLVIVIITLLFILSAATGINRGIRYLSWTNMVIAFSLMVFVFILGSTVQMLESFMTTMGNYIQNLPSMTFNMNAFTGERDFLNDWTLFYWAWWIGWSPFVGTFIARVSKGRTIREFVLGVTAVPLVFTAIWFAIMGVAGIEMDNASAGALYELISEAGEEVALFGFLENLPLAPIVMGLAVILISSFFITSADSGTFVLAMLTTGGRLNPSMNIKLIWGAILAGTAMVLLWSGGLEALEMAMLIAAFPFAFVVILMGISLVKALSSEYDILRLENKQKEFEPDYQEESKRELEEKREEFEQSLPEEEVEIEGEEKQ
ncbi:BCCT family transporter [Natribacillus halophilus]|uniref:Glycine betaine transporter n=1 Tax=Natribacillus halophilus TaxID=549003 RepID=A0A1G8M8I7_9BACI|nr:BCCT family transporter [Natribacillus halophilus]SDI64163.1 glycine betaine transporter [Natribacillus halophilus]